MHRSICDFTLDLVQNSIEASSSLVVLDVEQWEDRIRFYLSDNGPGMEREELEAARDPFYTGGNKHAARKVGLGIPFLVQAVEIAGGQFDISSEKGTGTSVTFSFDLENIDTPPLGDLSETFFAALTYPGDYEMVIHRRYIDAPASAAQAGDASADASYTLTRSELYEAVGGFEEVGSLKLLRRYIESQEESCTGKAVESGERQ